MESLTVTAWTAIYAAFVATANVGWSIYKDGFRDRARLKVRAGFRELVGNGVTEHDIIVYTITNLGGKPIYLTHVAGKKGAGENFIVVDNDLPKKLEPGQYYHSMCKRYEDMSQGVTALYVCDSTGREFYAPKTDVIEINKALKELAEKGIHRSWID